MTKLIAEKCQDLIRNWTVADYLGLLFISLFLLNLKAGTSLKVVGASWGLFTIGWLLGTLKNGKYSIAGLITVLAIFPALGFQFDSLFGQEIHGAEWMTLDYVVGNLVGLLIFRPSKRTNKLFHQIIYLTLFVLFCSATVAIYRNFHAIGDSFSFRGLYFNLKNFRQANWHDAYFPLRALLTTSLAYTYGLAIYSRFDLDRKSLIKQVCTPLNYVCFPIVIYGVVQSLTGLGQFTSGYGRGINVTFPDLHSFAALMAISFFACLFVAEERRAFGYVGALLCAIGLLLSQSKFQILAHFPLIILFFHFFKSQSLSPVARKKIWAALGIGFLCAVGGVLALLASHYPEIGSASVDNFSKWNQIFAYRPEQWRFALSTWLDFPVFGVGLGNYYHISSLPHFSTSPYAIREMGQNAHGLFIQILCETGVVGLIVILLPILMKNPFKTKCVSGFLLMTLLSSNIFAHSLLVRDMFPLFAVLLAFYFLEKRIEIKAVPGKFFSMTFAMVAIGSGIITFSAQQSPFKYGEQCANQSSLSEDGWLSGSVQGLGDRLTDTLEIKTDRPQTMHRPIKLSILNGKGTLLRTFEVDTHETSIIAIPEGSDALLVSQCFAPINHGISLDRRLLGLRLMNLN